MKKPSAINKLLAPQHQAMVWNTALALIIAAAALMAWHNRFIQDDAYISFRYAENLVNGHGLVWNPGERVEGYTNFLWVLIIAAGMKAGFSASGVAVAVGLALFVGSLLLVYRISMALFEGGRLRSLLAVTLVATNYTFSAYATGGLETQLQTFLLLLSSLVFVHGQSDGWSPGKAALLSVSFAVGLLARPDFLVFAAALGIPAAVSVLRTPGPSGFHALEAPEEVTAHRRGMASLIACLVLPGALIVAPWLAWKFWYYGDVLPNTFYVKATGLTSIRAGVKYVYHFLASYQLFPVFVLMAAPAAWAMIGRHAVLTVFSAMTVIWTLYIVKIGGCFMEFRLFVPVIPFIMFFLLWMIYDSGLITQFLRPALALAIVFGSALHMATYRCTSIGIQAIADLRREPLPWIKIGQQLRKDAGRTGIVISTTAAGAVPYYSGLTTVDEHGLNDKWIARHGRIVGNKPGHQRTVTLEYLKEKKVNLVMGHPMIVPRDGDDSAWRPYAGNFVRRYGDIAGRVTFITIPVEGTREAVAVWYLVRSKEVEAAIASRGWQRHEFDVAAR